MKWLWPVAIIGLVGCSPIWEGKAQAEKIAALEKRVTELEGLARQARVQDAERQTKLKECMAQADIDYWDFLRRNGTVQRDGSITSSLVVNEQARKNKEMRIQQCQALYGR